MANKAPHEYFATFKDRHGAQVGLHLILQQPEEEYDKERYKSFAICTYQSWEYSRKVLVGRQPAGCLTWTYRQTVRAARGTALV